ncbi:MAG: hypothetical protein Q8M16_08660 [Pirellulaceae bacterium]|nr:hypothetical protein [Pirellulaceae bacterium]
MNEGNEADKRRPTSFQRELDFNSLSFQNSTRESLNPMATSCPVLDMAMP